MDSGANRLSHFLGMEGIWDTLLGKLSARDAYRVIFYATASSQQVSRRAMTNLRIREEYMRRRQGTYGWVWVHSARALEGVTEWVTMYKMCCLQFERVQHVGLEIERVFHVLMWLHGHSRTEAFVAFVAENTDDGVTKFVISIVAGGANLQFKLERDGATSRYEDMDGSEQDQNERVDDEQGEGEPDGDGQAENEPQYGVCVALKAYDTVGTAWRKLMSFTRLASVTPDGPFEPDPQVMKELICKLLALAPLVVDNLPRVTEASLSSIVDRRAEDEEDAERYEYLDGDECMRLFFEFYDITAV